MSINQKINWDPLNRARAALRRIAFNDPARFEKYHLSAAGITLDYSRQMIDDDILAQLLVLANDANITGWRDRMFAGDAINTTENRAVLHTACRRPANDRLMVDGADIMPGIHAVLEQMRDFVDAIHTGTWRGHTGKPIDTIVNIGIGGSSLGPEMVVRALAAQHRPGIVTHFVSNVDGAHLWHILAQCEPETTLFLIASKTFTTQETMANATTARQWMIDHLADAGCVQRHFAALSTNLAAVKDFGIAPAAMFPFRDWVGGRYSLWSSIGLSIALATGFDHFRSLLDGAHDMDVHFRTAAPHQNMPVLLALLGIWNRNIMHYPALAVLPYDQRLSRFPAWLQQVDMESNGKSVLRDGSASPHPTGPVIFGEPGTDCQHSFFQLIHQGTDIIPCDFIAAIAGDDPYNAHHAMLLANMVAQADALIGGRPLTDSGNDPHRSFAGNRPSNIVLLDRLTPRTLGALAALYEHKVFVQGIIWGINSFDQFGVELGKIMADQALATLRGETPAPSGGVMTLLKNRLNH